LWTSSFPQPLLFAHRGASASAPENTLEAFRLAFEQGADGIELDAKLTADGHVIVIHDATVDRTTGGHGRVAELKLAYLRSLDAGSFFSPAFRGASIPTLDEVFETVGDKGLINIELTNYTTPRDVLVDSVCQLVRRRGLQRQVLFSSFLARNLSECARLLPEVARGLLALPGLAGAWARSFGFMFGDFHALHAHVSDVDPHQIQRVHRLGRRVHAWTVNRAEDIQRLRAWGVDGIFSDDPQVAARALGRAS